MLKFINAKVNRKLTAMCLILAIVICAACCISGYTLYRDATYKSYNDFAYEIGEVALSYVDTNKICDYLGPDYYNPDTKEFTPDEAYNRMAQSIYQVYVNTTMHTYNAGIYLCIPEKTDSGEYLLTNLFDVRIIELPEEKKAAYQLGVVDPMGVDNPDEVMKIFYSGERSKDYFVHESAFGFNSTAILPVKDGLGNTVALLMSDMPMPYVAETLLNFLLSTIILTVAVVAVFVGVFISIVRKSITKPLQLISDEADRFSNSDIEISEKLKEIVQTDEIGHLAESIYSMENDIKNYVVNLTQVTAEKERIGAELDVATQIQKSMLPCIFPAFPDRSEIEIYATMDPAKEVGGDFYDFFMVDESHVAFVAADVSGKGVPAALFMVIGKTLIKDHTTPGRDIGEVFAEVNQMLTESNAQNLFITCFEAVLDLKTGELRFANAGHETPFIAKKNGTFEEYKIRPGFVLAALEGTKYRSGSLMLEEGDRIFQYTDGVTEATDANNQLYGMDRLHDALNKNKDLSVYDLLPAVKADIDEFVGAAPQFDDITMICLEFKEKMKD